MIISLLLALCQSITPSIAPTPRPNVLVVVLDDVGVYDVDRVLTPTLDELASKGRSFTRAYSMPVCGPTRATMMYGNYDESLGAICSDVPDDQTPGENAVGLPIPFKRAGYSTAFFGKWHLGTNSVGLPWESTPQIAGYDSSFAVVPGNVSATCDGIEGDYYTWLAVENGVSYIENRYQTLVLRDKFLQWWSSVRGPKFAVVSFQAAHAPFQEPPAELLPYAPEHDFTNNRFAFEKLVITADFVLSQMLALVDSNTYIIVVGDNGTPPNAIGPGQDRNKVKTTPYEGGIHVPLIVVGPGIRPGESDALVSIVDLLPTLSDLLGETIDGLDGRSMVPVLKNPEADIHDHVFASSNRKRAVIQDRFKLIRLDDQELFFDVIDDPREIHPLNPNLMDPKTVLMLRSLMADYISRGL
jgi:arylsulfatase A-like enzyme